MNDKSMGKLVSIHGTAPLYWMLGLVIVVGGLYVMLNGVLSGEPVFFVIGLVVSLVTFRQLGLFGKPVLQLQIYEEGFVYLAYGVTQRWRWSDVSSITPARCRSEQPILTHVTGKTLKFRSLGSMLLARFRTIPGIPYGASGMIDGQLSKLLSNRWIVNVWFILTIWRPHSA